MIEGKIVQTGGKARRAGSTARCSLWLTRVPLSHAQELASQLEVSGYAEMGR